MSASSPTRRRMRAAARREQLLDAATDLAVERGFHALNVEAVATRAGVTRALIYQHFRDVQALLEAVVDREGSRALAQVTETALSDLGEGNARALMLESLAAFLAVVRDHPTTWRLVLMPVEGAPPILRDRIAAGRRLVLDQLARAVRPALQGRQEADVELTAHLLSAIADEYARLVLTDPERYSPERLLHHAEWWLDRPSFGL